MATVTGTNQNDILYGTSGADTLNGLDGDDQLISGAGADVMNGGSGSDLADYANSNAAVTINLSAGTASGGYAAGDTLISIENVTGSNYADTITCDNNGNVIQGLGGNDVLKAGAGADVLDGGAGIDTASFAYSTEAIFIDLANGIAIGDHAEGDTLISIENLAGTLYDDTLIGDDGDNGLSGGGGDDTLIGGLGADALIGGGGIDRTSYADSTSGVTVNLATGAGSDGAAQGDTYSSIEIVEGSAFQDFLTGGGGAETLLGGGGNDYLIGSAGADVLDGGDGVDMVNYLNSNAGVTISLNAGAASGGHAAGDTLISIEKLGGSIHADILIGDAADNWFDGNAGNDQINGGAGIDTASYAGATQGVYVNLSTGIAVDSTNDTDTLISIENVTGSNHADTINGDGGDNVLNGGGGADILNGRGGDDTLIGGSGDDLYYVNNTGVTVIEAVNGGDDEIGTTLNTFTLMDNVENLTFNGTGAFSGFGNALNNEIRGGADDDILTGGGGDDTLTGGDGVDTAVYHGIAYHAMFTQVADGWTISNQGAGDGADHLTGIEQAQFDDRVVYLDGRNNAPLTAGPLNVSTDEDASPLVVDLLTNARDFEGDALSVTNFVQTAGGPVTFSLDGDDLHIDPAQFEALAVGESATLTFAYDISDGADATARTLSVTVEGRNDAPMVAGPLSQTTNEDAAAITADLLVDTADVDTSDTLSVANFLQTGGLAASFSLDGGDFHLDPAQFDALADGQSTTLTFSFDVFDGAVGTARNLSVTVQGRNDAPTVAGPLSQTTNEDAAAITLDLLADTADVDTSDTLSVANFLQTGGLAASFSLDGGDFHLDPAQFDALADGQSTTLTFSFDVFDGAVGTARTLSVTVDGRDEPLTLVGTTGDETLTGMNANDTLTGGDGADILTGGGGADIFHYDDPFQGWDDITDFEGGADIIEVVSANFGGLAVGTLSASQFALDTATDTDTRFIFDTTTKILSYDSDGVGATASVGLATLNVSSFSNTSIMVVS